MTGQPETVAEPNDFEKRMAAAIVLNPDLTVGELVQLIRGVSAAARAEAFAEIRAGVEGLPWTGFYEHGIEPPLLASVRAAVLALLPPTEPK